MPDPSWKIIESEIKYKIEYGRENEIIIEEGVPPFPPEPPLFACETLKNGLVLIKWIMNKIQESGMVPPNWYDLHLFKLKDEYYSDPEMVPNPPFDGHDIVRSDTVPKKENSYIWKEYILKYWEYVNGPRFDQTCPDDEHDILEPSDRWPGERSIHHIHFTRPDDGFFYAKPINLIVTGIIPSSCTTKFLILLTIKRKGRLRLFARPIKIRLKIPSYECPFVKATKGHPLFLELQVLRHWRDERLVKSKLGRKLIKTYYALSHSISPIVDNSKNMRKLIRCFLKPTIKIIKSYNTPKLSTTIYY